MTKTVHATYDGEVLRLEEPIDLAPNTRVLVTIEGPGAEPAEASFLDLALSLRLEGPPDWSSRLDEYLYGEASVTDD